MTRSVKWNGIEERREHPMGNIDEVSSAIGRLEGDVSALTGAVRSADVARAEMHRDITDIKQSHSNLVITLGEMAKTLTKLSAQVEAHEVAKQQATGAKTIVLSALGSGGMLGLWTAITHLWKS